MTFILTLLGINIGAKAQMEQLESGLKNVLELTAQKFEKNNHAFIINLEKDNVVLFQLIHGGMLEQIRTENNEFNFSFNLTFDNEKEKEKKFKELNISNDFTHYEFDGMSSYAINFGNDRDKALKIILEVLDKVYGYSSTELFKFEIFDQGKF